MTTKKAFYKAFASLHRSRIDAFFDKVMTKDDFISYLLCVFVETLSPGDLFSLSKGACGELNSFLECDLYTAELMDVSCENGDFRYDFLIEILGDGDEIDLTFSLSNTAKDYEVVHEDIHFSGDKSKFWTKMNQRVAEESTFGTLKRS